MLPGAPRASSTAELLSGSDIDAGALAALSSNSFSIFSGITDVSLVNAICRRTPCLRERKDAMRTKTSTLRDRGPFDVVFGSIAPPSTQRVKQHCWWWVIRSSNRCGGDTVSGTQRRCPRLDAQVPRRPEDRCQLAKMGLRSAAVQRP
eukprot:SAG31_NODE_934_length_10895_cov_4.831249_1_plen_148_part_00